MIRLYIILCAMIVCSCLPGQEIIYLENPSFEDEPQSGIAPQGWYDCGFPNESPPDIQPSSDSDNLIYGNSFSSYDGNTYIAMVVRENYTWESVSQVLSSPLRKGEEYQFSVYLARSMDYLSPNKRGERVYFTIPTILRIFGGNSPCDKAELLDKSPQVVSGEWEQYTFTFHPEADYRWLILEVYYQDDFDFAYNGALFLDKCSPVYKLDNGVAIKNFANIELLIERIRACTTLEDTSETAGQELTHAEIIKRSSTFESVLYEKGLKVFLESISLQDLSKVISSLNSIQCEDLGLLLVEAGSIYHSNKSDTNMEKRWKIIEKLEQKCLKKLEKGELEVGIKSYVQAHFEKLNIEVENCE